MLSFVSFSLSLYTTEMEIIPEGVNFRLVQDDELPAILEYLKRYLPEAIKVCPFRLQILSPNLIRSSIAYKMNVQCRWLSMENNKLGFLSFCFPINIQACSLKIILSSNPYENRWNCTSQCILLLKMVSSTTKKSYLKAGVRLNFVWKLEATNRTRPNCAWKISVQLDASDECDCASRFLFLKCELDISIKGYACKLK